MASFFEIFIWCLVGIATFLAAMFVVAIVWYIVIPFFALIIVKMFIFMNKLSDKLLKKKG